MNGMGGNDLATLPNLTDFGTGMNYDSIPSDLQNVLDGATNNAAIWLAKFLEAPTPPPPSPSSHKGKKLDKKKINNIEEVSN